MKRIPSSSLLPAKSVRSPATLRIVSFVAGTVLALTVCSACGAPEPFYGGLGNHRMEITTDSPKARRYFNQGMAFLHGFNHAAAIRSFTEAI